MPSRILPLGVLVVFLAGAACTLSADDKAEVFTEDWVPFEYPYPQKSFTYDGMRIVYIDQGRARTDPAPVILIHGLAATLNNWDFVVDDLARDRRVVAVDLPGYGNSDKPHREYTMELFSGAIIALLDHLGVTTAHVVGNSMGGHIAAYTALHHPDRIASATLVGAAGMQDMAGGDDLRKYQQRLYETSLWFAARWAPQTREDAEQLHAETMREMRDTGELPFGMNPFYEVNDNAIEFMARQKAYMLNMRSKDFPAFLYAVESSGFGMAEASMAGVAQDITAPTLIIHGRNDTMAALEYGEAYHRAIPNSLFKVLDNCGHMPQVERAEEFVAILSAFLADPHKAVAG